MKPCDRPPAGWRCTRGEHLDGPCAAVPDRPTVLAPGLEWSYASPTRTLFKKRIGSVTHDHVDAGVELKIENDQLVLCWWYRLGTSFKGWLRAW